MNTTKMEKLKEHLLSLKSPEGAGARARRMDVSINDNPYRGFMHIDKYLKYQETRAYLWERGWLRADTLMTRLAAA